MKKPFLISVGLAGMLLLVGCANQPQMEQTNGASASQSTTAPAQEAWSQSQGQTKNQDPAYLDARYTAVVDTHITADNRPLPPTSNTVVVVNPQTGQLQSAPAPQPQMQQQSAQMAPVQMPPQRHRQERIKITGVGYGAESTYEGFTVGQRRLMAIRASKLDAYRSLAEQLYGIKIDSNTSVATLTAQSDSFRARVNAVVRGARIVSITPMSDNNYETVLEVFVDRDFFENVFVYSGAQHNNVMDPLETCTLGFNCYEAASYR
ncbi:MAG: LPP20 family lipoprotein [Thiomicrospira sp.]